jgi:hypothetical protein
MGAERRSQKHGDHEKIAELKVGGFAIIPQDYECQLSNPKQKLKVVSVLSIITEEPSEVKVEVKHCVASADKNVQQTNPKKKKPIIEIVGLKDLIYWFDSLV